MPDRKARAKNGHFGTKRGSINAPTTIVAFGVTICATIATDVVKQSDEFMFDGFYSESIQDGESLTNSFSQIGSTMPDKVRDERESRLLHSISAFCRTMQRVEQIDLAKLADKSAGSGANSSQKRKEDQLKLAEVVRKQLRGEKRTVQVSATFLLLSDVDTFKEQFVAEILMVSRWREAQLDQWTLDELKNVVYEDYFNPNLYVENLLVERRVTITNDVYRNVRGETFMIEKVLLRGTFTSPMSLKDFPFDVQDLCVVITTEYCTDEVQIVPNEHEISSLKIEAAVDQLSNTYHLYDHVKLTMRRIKSDLSGYLQDRPALSVSAFIARKPQYYWFNMFGIIFFITQLGSLTFVISPDNGSARAQVAVNLFLTVVNYKLSASLSMPKFSYLTCVDKYIILSIFSIFVLNFWHCFVAFLDGKGYSEVADIDKCGMVIIFGLYIVWNIIYFIWLGKSVCKRRNQMTSAERLWHKWVAKKQAWFRIRPLKDM